MSANFWFAVQSSELFLIEQEENVLFATFILQSTEFGQKNLDMCEKSSTFVAKWRRSKQQSRLKPLKLLKQLKHFKL